MKFKYIFAAALFCFCASLGYAQQTKVMTADKNNEYGLVYTLPKTAFRIDIVAVKEVKVAGPFSKYSKILINDDGAISKDETVWSIESVKVTPYGVADLENIYLMQLKPGSTTSITVADDNMLLAINAQPKLKPQSELAVQEMEGQAVTGKEYLEFVNEDFLAAQSSLKQAQLLTEELMEIRDAKLSLTRGTAETMPTDGKQLEIMLASLDRQEKSILNAFKGASWKERVVKTFTYIPEDEDEKTEICRLNSSNGIIDSDQGKGIPVYAYVINVEEAQLPVDAKGETKKFPKDGVVYCLPGNGDLVISLNSDRLFTQNYPMSQYGLTFGLNPSLFTDKKEVYFAEFDPATGALLNCKPLNQ